MARIVFTANIQRHVVCPEAEAAGRTVREVLENVFAQARGYVLGSSPHPTRCSIATITQKNTLAALILAAGLGPVAAQDAALETQIVDAMNKAYGVHPGFRANHAKGVVAEGTFIATPEAARLSKAVIFNGSPIPVTVRPHISKPKLCAARRSSRERQMPQQIALNLERPDDEMAADPSKYRHVS